jgi:sugar-specific transcriptional regulator TrmB
MNAGLTSLQSRVYLALIKEGKSNVTKISEVSDIDKSNVYRALKDLEKLELIETQIGPSKIYKPVPLSICLSILLKKKERRFL